MQDNLKSSAGFLIHKRGERKPYCNSPPNGAFGDVAEFLQLCFLDDESVPPSARNLIEEICLINLCLQFFPIGWECDFRYSSLYVISRTYPRF